MSDYPIINITTTLQNINVTDNTIDPNSLKSYCQHEGYYINEISANYDVYSPMSSTKKYTMYAKVTITIEKGVDDEGREINILKYVTID